MPLGALAVEFVVKCRARGNKKDFPRPQVSAGNLFDRMSKGDKKNRP